MDIDLSHRERFHYLGGSATHPMASRSNRHAALLVVAGACLLSPRPLPGAQITVPLGVLNCFFKVKTLLLCLALGLSAYACASVAYAKSEGGVTQITQLQIERADEALYLSAKVDFDVSAAVQEALLKTVPMVFVAQANVYRERWYWADKQVTSVTRTMRLAFQPLTRRWRLSVVSGVISSTGLQAALTQNYDSLQEALQAISRVARWRLIDIAELDSEAKYILEFRFSLDLSQLPRPFQIGVAGHKDWTIAVEDKQPLLSKEIAK